MVAKTNSSGTVDRPLPFDLDAEKSVLGSILYHPAVADEVVGILQPADFHSPAHQTIYTQMMEIHNSGKYIDSTLLFDRLKKNKQLEIVGGIAYLMEVADCTPHAANAVHYSRIVREKATLRNLIRSCGESLNEAHDEHGDAEEILSRAESRIFAIAERNTEGEQHSIQESLAGIFHNGSPKYIAGIETGFSAVDAILGGMRAQELTILGARPSQGKTALALNIAENLSIEQEKHVFMVSLEMSRFELAARLLCSRGRIDSYRFHADILNQSEKIAATKTHNEIATRAKLVVDDSPGRRVSDIAAAARRMKRKGALDIIIIDYLQLITPDNRREPRQEQVASISRRLKSVAKELDIPMLVLCQLNRQAEAEKPKLSHLRESGAIEQDADKVMFIYRVKDQPAEIIVAKNRNGRIGDAKLSWQPHFTRFSAFEDEKHYKNEWASYNKYDNGLDEEF